VNETRGKIRRATSMVSVLDRENGGKTGMVRVYSTRDDSRNTSMVRVEDGLKNIETRVV
jgi:hypothetical protein